MAHLQPFPAFIPMKTNTIILMTAVIITALAASCGKDLDNKTSRRKAVVPAIMHRNDVDPGAVFTLQRNGHIAIMKFRHDFSACKDITVMRNATGISRNRELAGQLDSKVRQFEDTLPNAGPHYYWIKVTTTTGAFKYFGPVRIGPDAERIGSYSNIEDQYRCAVTRTHSTATIAWDFPNIKYHHISVKRNSSRTASRRAEVKTTLEWRGKIEDVFPDPESDYWYWIDATLENGRVISRGPIKAEFAID